MVNIVENGFERTVFKPKTPIARVLLAHGAGAGNKHEFMQQFAQRLVELNIEVISFNFPYMQTVYDLDKKRPPNTNKILIEHFLSEIEAIPNDLPLFICGKSMGGRVASQVITQNDIKVKACIVFGYPFIPPGKPEKLEQRMAHFNDINKPIFILQGERDTFGGLTLLKELTLPSNFELSWVKSGDHSFKPLKSSGLTSFDNISFAAEKTVQFIQSKLN